MQRDEEVTDERSAVGDVERFLELESALNDVDAPESLPPDAIPDGAIGQVVGAERVSRTAVPDDYPVETTGDRALALSLRVEDEGQVVVYLDWPDGEEPSGQIDALLRSVGVERDAFGDLYGSDVPLDTVDGHVVVALDELLPGDEATGDRRPSTATTEDAEEQSGEVTGSVILTLLWAACAAAWLFTTLGGIALLGGWVAVAFLLVGAMTTDTEYVAAETDWEPSDWWTFGAGVLAPLVTPLYLIRRRSAFDN